MPTLAHATRSHNRPTPGAGRLQTSSSRVALSARPRTALSRSLPPLHPPRTQHASYGTTTSAPLHTTTSTLPPTDLFAPSCALVHVPPSQQYTCLARHRVLTSTLALLPYKYPSTTPLCAYIVSCSRGGVCCTAYSIVHILAPVCKPYRPVASLAPVAPPCPSVARPRSTAQCAP